MLEWLKTWPILVIALISTALMILLHRLGLLRRPKVSGVPLEEDDLAEAHYNLGVVLAEQGKTDEAVSEFRKALRLNPDDAEAHSNLGVALAEQGKIEEAIPEYQEALRLNLDYAEAHYNLGVALGKQGKTDEAIAEFRKALRLNPDDAEAHSNLGIALSEQGKIEEGQARSRAWRLTVTSLCATLCHRARQRRQEHERMVIGG